VVASVLSQAALVLGFLLVREPGQVWLIYLFASFRRLVPDRFRGRVFAAEMAPILSVSTYLGASSMPDGAAGDHDPAGPAVHVAGRWWLLYAWRGKKAGPTEVDTE
jgi:hypothetical protein